MCDLILKPIHKDNRGYFIEEFNSEKNDLNFSIKQVSESFSKTNTFRGFHFEAPNKMNKIVCVKKGHATFFCLNLQSKIVKTFDLKQIQSKDQNATYLYIPFNYAIGFFTHKTTIVRYLHDSVRSTNNKIIKYSEIDEIKKIENNIKHISNNDLNGINWEEWLKINEKYNSSII